MRIEDFNIATGTVETMTTVTVRQEGFTVIRTTDADDGAGFVVVLDARDRPVIVFSARIPVDLHVNMIGAWMSGRDSGRRAVKKRREA